MAEQPVKKTAEKPVKKTDKTTKKNFFQSVGDFFKKIPEPFKKMAHELRKVTWPTREKLVNYSIIVVLFMVFMMIVIGLLDTGASALVDLIMKI